MRNSYGFRPPVSGQKIPHGWFAALVRFMNSLILSGDGRYTLVDRDESGTTVTLSPAVIAALDKASGGAGGQAADQDLTVDVTGGTATVGLSGSTNTAQFVGTGNVNITGNTNGQIEIGVTGGTGGAGYPVWRNLIEHTLSEEWDSGNHVMSPIVLAYSGYLRITYTYNAYIHNDNPAFEEDVCVYVDGKMVWRKFPDYTLEPYVSGDTIPVVLRVTDYIMDCIPVCAGSTVTATCSNLDDSMPSLYLELFQDTTA